MHLDRSPAQKKVARFLFPRGKGTEYGLVRQPPDAIPTLDEVALEKEGKKGDGEAQAQAQQELNTCTHRKRTRWHPHPSAVLQGNEEISGERPYPPGIFRLVVHPTTRAARGDSTDYRTRSGSEPSMATWRSRAPPSSRSPASVAAWAQAAPTADNGARSLVSPPCCPRKLLSCGAIGSATRTGPARSNWLGVN